MAVPFLDTSLSPIWVARWPDVFTIDEYRAYLEAFIASCREGERYGVIADLTEFKPMSGDAKTRAGVAQAIKENMDIFERHIVGEVRIMPNPLVRAVGTLFDWASPLPWPTRNVTNRKVADSWLHNRMRQSGISLDGLVSQP